MRDDDSGYIPGARRPGFGTVVFVSMLTSAAVSIFTVTALMRWGTLGAALQGLGLQPQAPAHAPDAPAARIPDVVGMSAEAADELLTARKLRLVVQERRAHPTVPAGSVIAQTPLAQSRIGPGGEVAVVLSTGPGHTQVPDVVGKPLDEAKRTLEAAGLHIGPVAEVDTSTGQAGSVTATAPAPGTALEPGASVGLTVARLTVVVPPLLGQHVRKARDLIEKAGLSVGDVSEIYDEHRRGNLVLTQKPEPGSHVAAGSKVDIVVNQGD
jgi:serine/threonine-protein kinase